ncbi:MAG: sugar phosphate isomerase/epimerase [Phycisphaerae bacterium]|nr:sugar phosphate isomerase/epimerase [Phycisphaerae bacterium]
MITFSAFADEIADDLTEQIDVCEANGVRCIDVRGIDGVNVSKLTVEQARQYKQQLGDRGFRVPCIGSPIGKINISDDFDVHLDLFKHCCDVARAFGTQRIRVFSFYPSEGADIADQRDAVMERMRRLIDVAEQHDVLLMHENEKAIYGAVPDRVLDLFETLGSPRLQGVFDPANYVEEGVAPYDDGWRTGLDERTHYVHVKDYDPAREACVPAGQGNGQFDEIFRDLRQRDWDGFATLEPHLAQAGQFSGHTGAALFADAVAALRDVCDRAGLTYQ